MGDEPMPEHDTAAQPASLSTKRVPVTSTDLTTERLDASDRDAPAHDAGRQNQTLRVIAAFKLLKALVLMLAGLGALGLLNANWTDAVVDVLHQLALEHGRRLASAFAERGEALLSSATPGRLTAVAFGCFVYGGVFLVEAIGLWKRKRWAEYLTTIMTASLLPFEVVALAHRVTFERGLALALNVAIVAYLVFHLWRSHRRRNA